MQMVNHRYNYEQLKDTDHAEVLKLTFDQYKISLKEIIDHLFRIIDPISVNKQGNDIADSIELELFRRRSSFVKRSES